MNRYFYIFFLSVPFIPVVISTLIRITGAFAGCAIEANSCHLFGYDLGQIFLDWRSLGPVRSVFHLLFIYPTLSIFLLFKLKTFHKCFIYAAAIPILCAVAFMEFPLILDFTTIHSGSDGDNLFWGAKIFPGSMIYFLMGLFWIIAPVSLIWSIAIAGISYFIYPPSSGNHETEQSKIYVSYFAILFFPILLILFNLLLNLIVGTCAYQSGECRILLTTTSPIFSISLAGIYALFIMQSFHQRFLWGTVFPIIAFGIAWMIATLFFHGGPPVQVLFPLAIGWSVFTLITAAFLDSYEKRKGKQN